MMVKVSHHMAESKYGYFCHLMAEVSVFRLVCEKFKNMH
jgi:hypothetical protein